MATYDQNENSASSSAQTFFYWFIGPGFEFKWTSAPKKLIVDVADPPAGHSGDDVEFKHPKGGIAHRDFTSSPDAGRTGFEVVVSPRNPIILRHRAFPPPGDTTVDVYRQNEDGGELRRIWSGTVFETPIERTDDDEEVGVIRCQHATEEVVGSDGLTETFGPGCPYRTYHFPCPAVMASHRTVVTVTDIDTDNFEITVSGITQIDHWFNAGQAEAPNGDRRMVLLHEGDVITVLQNFPSLTLRVGDTLNLFDGDDYTFATCRDKFPETVGGKAFGGNNLQADKNPYEIGRLN